ncbi:phage tail sheath family protein [Pseudanabaenaceae cyanobacterium LEGE 13415]|nr:phage tail sheath family protein [Pseudanabaenaceae cyanobacterium LEGE 13415]
MLSSKLIPGVYVQDVYPVPEPQFITGVPVFLGVRPDTSEVLCNTPYRFRLWAEFEQQFYVSLGNRSYLPDTVRGFFENGGQLCYVLFLLDQDESTLQQALAELEAFDQVDLICAPDLWWGNPSLEQVTRMQQLILEHCDRMNDRFAILDAALLDSTNPNAATIAQLQQQYDRLLGNSGAMYAPWLKIMQGNGIRQIPPCGHIAGIYSKTDNLQGVFRTPANNQIDGIIDISYTLSAEEVIELANDRSSGNHGSINSILPLPGRGVRVWGGRTLSRMAEWRYISVRRLFLTIHRWIVLNLANFTFEPNDFRLQLLIERELTRYLESLLEQGALQGTTPAAAFYVRCNAETTSIEQQDAGRLIAQIGIAPTTPNEFIDIQLIHGETGVSLVYTSPP